MAILIQESFFRSSIFVCFVPTPVKQNFGVFAGRQRD